MIMSIVACVFSVGLLTSFLPALMHDGRRIRYEHTQFTYDEEKMEHTTIVTAAYHHKVKLWTFAR